MTAFPRHIDNYQTTLAAPYVAGSGTATVSTGPGITLTSGQFLTLVASSGSGASLAILGHLKVTGVAGTVLTVQATDGFADVNLPAGTTLTDAFTAIEAAQIATAVNALETGGAGGALVAANNLSDLASASTARVNLGLGSAATHAASDFLAPNGDGSSLTGTTDAGAVHRAGSETITGAKAFTTLPTLGTLTGLVKAATGSLSTATAGADYLAPNGSGAALTGLSAAAIVGVVPTANLGTGSATTSTYLRGDGSWQAVSGGGGSSAGASGVVQVAGSSGAFGAATGVVYGGAGVDLAITSQGAARVPFKVVGASGQTANLTEWWSADSVLSEPFVAIGKRGASTALVSLNNEGGNNPAMLSLFNNDSPILQIGTGDTGAQLVCAGNSCFTVRCENISASAYPALNFYINGGSSFYQYNNPLNSSGTTACHNLTTAIHQSGTAGYTGLSFFVTEASTGSGPRKLVEFGIGSTPCFAVHANGDVTLGPGNLSNGSTGGFAYIPVWSGTPTGTPVSRTGFGTLGFDQTAKKLWMNIGGVWYSSPAFA